MAMRLSGLMSGMDTESIVSQLVEARKTKVTKAVKAQKSLKFKQDAWKDLNKQIVNLYNKSLTNMRFQSSYMKKTTKVSNSNVVSVITGESAMNSVQSLEVKDLAKTGFLTGGKIQLKDSGGTITSDTKLSELGLGAGTGTFQLKIDHEVTPITVDENSTVGNFVSTLRSAGVNANFDEGNQRIYISSKTSGEKSNFELQAVDAQGFEALNLLKLSYAGSDGKIVGQQELIDSYNKILEDNNTPEKKENTIKAGVDAQVSVLQQQWENYKNSRAGLIEGFDAEIIEKINEKLDGKASFKLTGSGELLMLEKGGTSMPLSDIDQKTWGKSAWTKLASAIDSVKVDLEQEAATGATEEEKAKAGNLAASLDGWLTNQKNLKDIEDKFEKNADGSVKLDGDKVQLTTEEETKIREAVTKEVEGEITAAQIAHDKLMNSGFEANANKTAGSNARIILNGEEYKSEKNTFEINGLTLTVSATTKEGEEVTITTEDDTNGIYDMVKNFFKEYNTVINQMDKLYNADAAKGYDPLTDEEKEAMSDSQIEEWENKIKDAILRKDSTLSFFSGEMKRIMMEGVEMEDGKKMYLSNFGIGTLNYYVAADNERNAYHIDGDPDDENTSSNPDKLKSMIANDPDTVVEFFTKLSQKLSDKMFDMMKSEEGISSAMTVYEDKRMQKEYDDYTTKIKELEKKLADYEDKWYAKFAAMETALAKMQNNASAVTSLLGG